MESVIIVIRFCRIEENGRRDGEKIRHLQPLPGIAVRSIIVLWNFPILRGGCTSDTQAYTAMDIIARKRRMEGYNVLFPIGYDAFGLTENYAINNQYIPEKLPNNIERFTSQLRCWDTAKLG